MVTSANVSVQLVSGVIFHIQIRKSFIHHSNRFPAKPVYSFPSNSVTPGLWKQLVIPRLPFTFSIICPVFVVLFLLVDANWYLFISRMDRPLGLISLATWPSSCFAGPVRWRLSMWYLRHLLIFHSSHRWWNSFPRWLDTFFMASESFLSGQDSLNHESCLPQDGFVNSSA
jgi:hypothetical protein